MTGSSGFVSRLGKDGAGENGQGKLKAYHSTLVARYTLIGMGYLEFLAIVVILIAGVYWPIDT